MNWNVGLLLCCVFLCWIPPELTAQSDYSETRNVQTDSLAFNPDIRLTLNRNKQIEGDFIEAKGDEYVKMRLDLWKVVKIGGEYIQNITFLDPENPLISEEQQKRLIYRRLPDLDFSRAIYGVMDFSLNWQKKNDLINFGGLHNHYIIGYRWHPLLSTGVGTGFESYSNNEHNMFFIPILMEVRGYIPTPAKVLAPYYRLVSGYNFSNSNRDVQYSSSLFIKPALGLRMSSRQRVDVLLEFGYHLQNLDMEYRDRDEFGILNQILVDLALRRFYIGLGLML